jgi:hypothetical protein
MVGTLSPYIIIAPRLLKNLIELYEDGYLVQRNMGIILERNKVCSITGQECSTGLLVQDNMRFSYRPFWVSYEGLMGRIEELENVVDEEGIRGFYRGAGYYNIPIKFLGRELILERVVRDDDSEMEWSRVLVDLSGAVDRTESPHVREVSPLTVNSVEEAPAQPPQAALQRVKGQCCACLTEQANYLMIPCNHLCVCEQCMRMIDERGQRQCPICRSELESVLRVHLT